MTVAGPLLRVDGLSKTFGGLSAISDLSMEVGVREIRAVIGPNGAGKSTFMNLITGLYRPSMGTIKFDGVSIVGKRPSEIVSRGMVRTFQHPALFDGLNVHENVLLTATACKAWTPVADFLGTSRSRSVETEASELAMRSLAFVGLQSKAKLTVERLSPAERRLVEVARALAAKPRLLLLDEPFAGMTQTEARFLKDLILEVRDQGTGVVLIDHNMSVVMDMADKVTVLSFGHLIFDGKAEAARESEAVIDAYLGSNHGAV